MSNRNEEADYSQLVTAFKFAFSQYIKDIHTAFPGLILSYDPGSKRARILPGLKMLLTSGKLLSRAPIANVPVVFPSGGGLALTFPLPKGTPVWVMCSERGMSAFKRQFKESAPDLESIFDAKDAVAWPGFGATSITKAGAGAALQTEDAEVYVEVEAGGVNIRKGTHFLTLNDDGFIADIDGKVVVVSDEDVSVQAPKLVVIGDLEVTRSVKVGNSLDVDGGTIRNKGRDVGATHTHAGVQPGGGISGPPK